MPTSDPEARRRTSANNNEAITSVRLFISRTKLSDKLLQSLFSLSLWERAGERACLCQASHPPLTPPKGRGSSWNIRNPVSNHHHRNFKVVRLSKANRIARIKKRKTIFDS